MNIQPTVSVVIVNYCSGHYAKACIESLLKQEDVFLEIIVVDNNSADDSVSVLQQAFSNQIKLITSSENLGFGRANNLAANQATSEYLLLLNPDTEIGHTKAIVNLVEFLNMDSTYGVAGPAIFEAKRAGGNGRYVKIHSQYPAQNKLKNKKKFIGLPGEIAWLLGACLLFRRQVFESVGGFDADYFLYGEDADIGLRIRQHGFKIGYCKSVEIKHIAGTSEIGATSFDKWLRKKRGLYLFFSKHYFQSDVINICLSAKRYLIFSRLTQQFILLFNPGCNKSQEKFSKAKAELVVIDEVLNIIKSKQRIN